MDESVKKTLSYYIKTTVISLFIVGESFLLTKLIAQFIEKQNYFTPDFKFLGLSVLFLTLILITNALGSGSWYKWEQFVFAPLSVAAGIFLVIFPINSAYAIIISFIVIWLIIYDNFLASLLRNQMIKFNPNIILRYSSKGIILAYSITATILVLISTGSQPELNLGSKAADLAEKYIAPKINQEMVQQVNEGLPADQLNRLTALGLDPAKLEYSESSTLLNAFPNFKNIDLPKMSIRSTVESEVNNIIEPYKRFLNPVMAILMFGLMQFIGFFTFLIYTIMINVVFYVAKKTGFLKISKVMVEKETLHF